MILNFPINFNTFLESSYQSIYDSFINKHQHSFACPNSNCEHSTTLSFSTTYNRFIYLDVDMYIILNVAVSKCARCNTYHAILPAFILPYSSYSYPFIIKTLNFYFFGSLRGNKTKVCQFMHISRKVFNHFLSIFSLEEIRCLNSKMLIQNLKEAIHQLHKQPSSLYLFLLSFSNLNIIFLFIPSHRNLNFTFFNTE